MYYATTYAQAQKNKVRATLVTMQGEFFEGAFFVAGEQRLKDLLNSPDEFLPFETSTGAVYLMNRASIARVEPQGEDPAAMRPAPAEPDQSSDNRA